MPASTAITDRLSLTLDEVKVKLRIDGNAEDDLLTALLDGAKNDADEFCQNLFQDDDGVDLDIPAGVKTWVLAKIARDYTRSPLGLQSATTQDLGSTSWREDSYDQYRGLYPHRVNPGF